MTLKEKIMKLQTYKMFEGEDTVYVERDDILELLEKEPCEDAVSRQAVLDLCDSKDPEYKVTHFKEDVECLPSVYPKPKTGHWIFDDECKEHGHCSRCGYGSVDLVNGEPHNFCPNCGAKMFEPQERSERMTDEQIKQAILGFTEFFKGITGNQNLEIPSEIAEKYGIQAQAESEDE